MGRNRMNRLTRNMLGFAIGIWLGAALVTCSIPEARAMAHDKPAFIDKARGPVEIDFVLQVLVCGARDKLVVVTMEGAIYFIEQHQLSREFREVLQIVEDNGDYFELPIEIPGECDVSE
jgi:hypothetical protein